MKIIILLLSILVIGLLYYINKNYINSYFKRLHYKISKRLYSKTEKDRNVAVRDKIITVGLTPEEHNDAVDELREKGVTIDELQSDVKFVTEEPKESNDSIDEIEDAMQRILESTSDIHFGDSYIWSATMEFKFLRSYNGEPRRGHYLHQKMISNIGEEKWESIKFEE